MSDCGCNPDVPVDISVSDPLIDPNVTNPLPDTEPFLIPLCLTRAQYGAIIASLHYAQGLLSDNGCYEERNALEFFMKHLPFANKPLEIPCMDACDIISECITENPGTIEALNSYMTTLVTTNTSFMQTLASQVFRENPPYAPISEDSFSDPVQGDLLPEDVSAECNPDKLFGAAGGIVDYINSAITDIFEALEQASNTIEYSAIAAQLAPAIGSTASSAIEFADQVQETLAEAYAGEFTVELRDQLACDIFCRAQAAGCHITLETLNAMLLDRLATVDFDDFAEFVLYFTTGAFEGTQVVEVAFMLAVQALRYGGQFAGILGLSPLAVIAKRAAASDPDPSWVDLCDCVGYVRVSDFTIDEQSWYPITGFGHLQASYNPGVGWQISGDPVRNSRITIGRMINPAANIDTVRVESTSPTISGDTQTITIYNMPAGTPIEGLPYSPNALFNVDFSTGEIWLDVVGDADAAGTPIPGAVFKITFTGVGTPPF